MLIGVVLAADTAVDRRPARQLAFELAVGAIVGAVALLRGRGRVLAAAAGLAVAPGGRCRGGRVSRCRPSRGPRPRLGLLVLGAAAMRVAAARQAALHRRRRGRRAGGGAVARPSRVHRCRSRSSACWPGAAPSRWGSGCGSSTPAASWRSTPPAATSAWSWPASCTTSSPTTSPASSCKPRPPGSSPPSGPETLDGTLAGIESAGNRRPGRHAPRRRPAARRRRRRASSRPAPKQLADLVRRFADHGPAVRLRLPDDDQPPWPPEVATTVYRVVQEALTNIVLHAPSAAEVTVIVEKRPVRGHRRDRRRRAARPVRPARSRRSGGYGLVGMRERVEALGGDAARRARHPAGGWVGAGHPAAAPAGSGRDASASCSPTTRP